MNLEGIASDSIGRATVADEISDPAEGQELLEFLAADVDPIPADPAFRERLREELWSLVQESGTTHPKDH